MSNVRWARVSLWNLSLESFQISWEVTQERKLWLSALDKHNNKLGEKKLSLKANNPVQVFVWCEEWDVNEFCKSAVPPGLSKSSHRVQEGSHLNVSKSKRYIFPTFCKPCWTFPFWWFMIRNRSISTYHWFCWKNCLSPFKWRPVLC